DTLLAAYLLDPIRSKCDLGDLAREASVSDGWTETREGWTDEQWRTAETADLTAQVADVLHGRILEQGLETIYNEMELPLAPLLYRMEQAGLRVDTKALAELSKFFGAELEKLTAQIYQVAGREFKISSPKQVGEVLEELNISKGRKTSTGQVSTSRAVLDELAQQYELPRLIIEYRELDKLKATYTDSLPALVGAHGATRLRRADERGIERETPLRQDRQLRHRLRGRTVWPLAARRHLAQRGEAGDRGLLQNLQRRARVHGQDSRRGPRARLRALHVRPHPAVADHQRPQRPNPRPRRTRSHQHADSRHGERHR